MARTKLQTEIRQQQIVQAALEIVAAEGPRGLSMARVAARLNLVPSAIYRHFPGKQAMLQAALGLIQRKLQENVRLATEATSDPVEQLHELLRRHVRMIRENLAIPRVIFNQDAYGDNPELLGEIRGMLGRLLRLLAAMVRRGQQAGRVAAHVDPRTAALMFMGIIQPMGIVWHLTGGRFDVRRQMEKSWGMYRRALVGDGEARGRDARGTQGPEALAT
jgi:AcrR family transcriptional regulator